MAMTVRNTRSYGKGFGDLNCPGDPGCPGYIDPAINQAIQAALADSGAVAAPIPASVPATPSWIDTVSRYSMAIYAGSALLVVLALFGGGRR